MAIIEIKFEGIDSWSRPIFKGINSELRFGSVERLIGFKDIKEGILDTSSESDLCYFGREFDCEPLGGIVKNIKIIKEVL